MRILTVANHLGSRGGLERNQLTMCRALAERGHVVDVAFASAGDFTKDWEAFSRRMVAIEGSLPRARRPVRSTIGVARGIVDTVRLRPDVIYVFRPLDIPFAVVVGALCRAPVVFHLCLPQPNKLPLPVRWSLRHVALTLSVSHDTAGLWMRSGLRPSAIQVVHTGMDMDHYVPAPLEDQLATRRELGIEPGAFVTLFAGRLASVKGVDVLVQAFAQVSEKVPGARLVIVGAPSLSADPADAERYIRSLHELGSSDDILWLEARKDVEPLIQMADVVAAPSRWPEPFSRSVIEPLACGVPVVATRVGGNAEILVGWLAEYLVPADDVDALAERLVSLSSWKVEDPGLGSRCRDAVVVRLSLDQEVDAVESALARLAGKRQPTP
jgi:glycosyltransferase involved in cell wall biosynthesis